jgi:CRP/FNR family nitrogen fixation transcriptional regulator
MWITNTDRPGLKRNFIFPGRPDCIEGTDTQRRLFAKGRELFADGDPARFVYRVVRGAVRTSTLLPDARRQIHSFLFADEIFGFESTDRHSCTADAIQETVVETFRASDFNSLVGSSPVLADELIMALMASLERARGQMLMLARRDSREKLAIFLLELAARLNTDRLELVMSRADIADHLGMTRETVSRTLTSLARDGLIFLECAPCVILSDKKGLRRILLAER